MLSKIFIVRLLSWNLFWVWFGLVGGQWEAEHQCGRAALSRWAETQQCKDTHHTKDKVQRHPLHPSKRGCRPKPTPRTPQNLLKSRTNLVDDRQSWEGMRGLPNLSQSWPQPLPVRTQGGGKKRDLWLVVALTFLLMVSCGCDLWFWWFRHCL